MGAGAGLVGEELRVDTDQIVGRRSIRVRAGAALVALLVLTGCGAFQSDARRPGTGLIATSDNLGEVLAPPIVSKRTVVLFSSGEVLGIDRTSREIVWRAALCERSRLDDDDLGGAVGLCPDQSAASGRADGDLSRCYPLPADRYLRTFGDRVVAICGSSLVSIRGEDGTLAWSVALNGDPDRVRVSDKLVAVHIPGHLSVRDGRTGEERWSRDMADQVLRLAVDNDRVYAGEGRQVLALDGRTGEERWAVEERAGWLHFDRSLLIDRTSKDQMSGIAQKSGEVRWTTQATGDDLDALYTSVILGVSDERIVLTDDARKLYGFDADGGDRRWTLSDRYGHVDDASVGDGRVAVLARGHLLVLDVDDGRVLDDNETTASSVTIDRGDLVYFDESGLAVQSL